MILNVKFADYNQQDNLHLTVLRRSSTVIYENEKWLNGNERLWVKIYTDGFASYGLEMQKDPQHNNCKYTWSSRPEVINEYFELNGTPYQLARYDIGVQEHESPYSCYCSAGILLKKALLYAEYNQYQLKYGFFSFLKKNDTSKSYHIISPRKGVTIGRHVHELDNECYLDCRDEDNKPCLIRLSETVDYYMKKQKYWYLKEVFGTIIDF